jgi:voltage-gated sodium channel
MRTTLSRFIDHSFVRTFIIALIIINAIILGLDTYPTVKASHGALLHQIDHAILWVFVVELSVQFIAKGPKYFKDPWALFDLFVVGIAFVPAQEAFSVLRAARVLRIFRLVSAFPNLRRIVQGLLTAIPGIGAIIAILLIIFYIFSVMATTLYGPSYPQYFGSLQASLFTLFQIMTLEGWPDIVRQVLETHPYAWIFFVIYILISTFAVLNLFIAIIVDSMQAMHKQEEEEEESPLHLIQKDIKSLHQKINQMSDRLKDIKTN